MRTFIIILLSICACSVLAQNPDSRPTIWFDAWYGYESGKYDLILAEQNGDGNSKAFNLGFLLPLSVDMSFTLRWHYSHFDYTYHPNASFPTSDIIRDSYGVGIGMKFYVGSSINK